MSQYTIKSLCLQRYDTHLLKQPLIAILDIQEIKNYQVIDVALHQTYESNK